MNEYQRKLQEIKEQGLTQALLREWFDYNPETGWLSWKSYNSWLGPGTGQGGNRRKDKRAGNKYHVRRRGKTIKTAYRRVQIGKALFIEHRLIWLHVYGSLPKWPNVIDHVNGDGTDNRLVNLREATPPQNALNVRRRVGIRSVWKTKTGWAVRLSVNFKTKEEASQFAYDTMKKFHGDFITPEMYGLQKQTYANGESDEQA